VTPRPDPLEDPAEQPEPYLVERARQALATDPRVSELHVEVTTVGRKVFLTGAVQSEERRGAAGEVVAAALPGFEVANHITVESIGGEPDVEVLP
jgi:osmotically-inducible protein OsmY